MFSKFLGSGFRRFSTGCSASGMFGKSRPLTSKDRNERTFYALMSLGKFSYVKKNTYPYVYMPSFLFSAVATTGAAYAAVPLYRLFCQSTGFGGTTALGHDASQVATMEKVKERIIRIEFNADTEATIQWNFKPQQTEIDVRVFYLSRLLYCTTFFSLCFYIL